MKDLFKLATNILKKMALGVVVIYALTFITAWI